MTSSFSTERRLLDREKDAAARAWYAEAAAWDVVATFEPAGEGRAAGGGAFVFDQVYGPCVGLRRLERPGPRVEAMRLEP